MPKASAERTGTEDLQAERRQRILDAAATVFAQRGFHRARTRDIAAAAEVAEGTIFNYFPTKRDLLFALIERLVTESMPRIVAHADEMSVADLLEAITSDRLNVLATNRALLQAVAPELFSDAELRDAFLQRVIAPMLDWLVPVLRGVFARQGGDFLPRVVMPAIVGGTLGAFLASGNEGLPLGPLVSHAEISHQLAHFYTRGLQVEPEKPLPTTASFAPSPAETTSVHEEGK